MHPHRHPGFTLIELLVVISIIAILAGLLLPAIKLVKEQAEGSRCGSQMRQIGMAALAYANDNESYLPIGYVIDGGSNGYHGTTSYYNAWIDYFGGGTTGAALLAKSLACPAANRKMGVSGNQTGKCNPNIIAQFQPSYSPNFTSIARVSRTTTTMFMLDAGVFNYQNAGGWYAADAMFMPPIMPHKASEAWTQTNASPAYANNNQGMGYYSGGSTVALYFDGHSGMIGLDATAQSDKALPWPRPGLNLRKQWNLFWNDSDSK